MLHFEELHFTTLFSTDISDAKNKYYLDLLINSLGGTTETFTHFPGEIVCYMKTIAEQSMSLQTSL
jgi:hypothetical protein